jgi:hypothetical protein
MKQIYVVKTFATITFLLAFLLVQPAARADEFNQETKLTFNQAVQISGHVLPAGTYLFVLPDDINHHEEVHIFSSDRRKLYAIVLTASAERSQPTANTAFTFARRGSEQPQAIVTWFYPGKSIGHEFLYPKQVREELAAEKKYTVVAAGF